MVFRFVLMRLSCFCEQTFFFLKDTPYLSPKPGLPIKHTLLDGLQKPEPMRNLLQPVRDLVYLLYPHLCLACSRNAPPYGQDICTPCKATLPESNYHHQKVNPFTEKVLGKAQPADRRSTLSFYQKKEK